jgi:DDE_Tnp_1-associated
MATGSDRSLVAAFAAPSDPRQVTKALYPLPESVLLLLCATLAGADDLVEIEVWGEQNLALPHRLLPYAHGIPSYDTPGAVVAMLDPVLFRDCFTAWVSGCASRCPRRPGRK